MKTHQFELGDEVTQRSYRIPECRLLVARETAVDNPLLDNPAACAKFWRTAIEPSDHCQQGKEICVVLFLNTRRNIIGWNMVAMGTLDGVLVHPREVFRPAIVAGASAIVMAHNHPSGDPTPSEADIKMTRELIQAGKLLRLECLDHIIMGQPSEQNRNGYCSLRELGYF